MVLRLALQLATMRIMHLNKIPESAVKTGTVIGIKFHSLLRTQRRHAILDVHKVVAHLVFLIPALQ